MPNFNDSVRLLLTELRFSEDDLANELKSVAKKAAEAGHRNLPFPSRSTIIAWAKPGSTTKPRDLDRRLLLAMFLLYRKGKSLPSREQLAAVVDAIENYDGPPLRALCANWLRAPLRPELHDLDMEALVEGCISSLVDVHTAIIERIDRLKTDALLASGHKRSKLEASGKRLTLFDQEMEITLLSGLREKLGEKFRLLGEESIGKRDDKPNTEPFNWNGFDRAVLVDAIDGSDYLPLGINLWCSALVALDLTNLRILFSAVCLASGEIVFARHDRADAFILRHGSDLTTAVLAAGPSAERNLEAAHIAFFGQKPRIVVQLSRCSGFAKFCQNEAEKDDSLFRLYNFAGNPMLAQLANRPKGQDGLDRTHGIDAVFEITGQRPHDFVPGAFVALKAGATLLDVESGENIAEVELARMASQPERCFTYVAASTEALSRSLRTKLL